ncbi:MAG: hypothetical protein ACJASD_000802 [Sphingomonas echinoides]|jgi:hypothetical protein
MSAKVRTDLDALTRSSGNGPDGTLSQELPIFSGWAVLSLDMYHLLVVHYSHYWDKFWIGGL